MDMLGATLAEVRANKFLNSRSVQLKLLPPTENAFVQHVRRCALATVIDKSAHLAINEPIDIEEYGWIRDNGTIKPLETSGPLKPRQLIKNLSCGCTKGCNRNCSCAK